MTRSATWVIRLRRLVLAILLAFYVFAAAAVLLITIQFGPLLVHMAGMISPANLTPGATMFLAIMASPSPRILFCMITLERLIVVAVVFVALSRMLHDAARGTSFSATNVGRLRMIAEPSMRNRAFRRFLGIILLSPLAAAPSAQAQRSRMAYFLLPSARPRKPWVTRFQITLPKKPRRSSSTSSSVPEPWASRSAVRRTRSMPTSPGARTT